MDAHVQKSQDPPFNLLSFLVCVSNAHSTRIAGPSKVSSKRTSVTGEDPKKRN